MMIESLRNTLTQKSRIPFAEFMQLALYAPDGGYYSSNLTKLGRQGDFVTAPEISPLFGYTLARQCQQIIQLLNKPCLFEFGAGSGKLCMDLLIALEKLDSLPEQYFILEVSGFLKQQQQQLIQEKIPHLADRVIWLNTWPDTPFEGVVLANEILDAMPIHRFLQTADGLMESFISMDDQGLLQETFLPCTNQALTQHVQAILPETELPYLSEANMLLKGWLQACYSMLKRGAQIMIDYGFPRTEYYHPDRNQGTLMCHFQHQAHTNPLLHPGEQDITAHVDFTHVAECAHEAGFHVAGFSNQASFLLANGILENLEAVEGTKEKFINTQAVKQLLHPEEMGELFKVIALTKGIDCRLKGFELLDKRASL